MCFTHNKNKIYRAYVLNSLIAEDEYSRPVIVLACSDCSISKTMKNRAFPPRQEVYNTFALG